MTFYLLEEQNETERPAQIPKKYQNITKKECCGDSIHVESVSFNSTVVYKRTESDIEFCLATLDPINEIPKTKDLQNILESLQNKKDVVRGSYEGGLKVWECTFDLLDYLPSFNFNNLSVLDLGCGCGLAGIAALKLGANRVDFQDYNETVLQVVTIPNVLVNQGCVVEETVAEINDELLSSNFFACDWDSLKENSDHQYDVVIMSEVLYDTSLYPSLVSLLRKICKENLIVGTKSYYFGLGGNCKDFSDMIEPYFQLVEQKVYEGGVTREVLVFKRK